MKSTQAFRDPRPDRHHRRRRHCRCVLIINLCFIKFGTYAGAVWLCMCEKKRACACPRSLSTRKIYGNCNNNNNNSEDDAASRAITYICSRRMSLDRSRLCCRHWRRRCRCCCCRRCRVFSCLHNLHENPTERVLHKIFAILFALNATQKICRKRASSISCSRPTTDVS